MSSFYLLKDKVPYRAVSAMEWSKEIEKQKRVDSDDIGGVHISTVFLGIDHNFRGSGDPILFETMIFGGPMDGYQERYHLWDEAEQGHKKAVGLVLSKLGITHE